MTQEEFVAGWALLILQPWGWRYRSINDDGQPSNESGLQLRFYYSKVKWAHGSAWYQVASDYAAGNQWPSVGELNQALRFVNRQYVKALSDERSESVVPMPDEVRQILRRVLGKDIEEVIDEGPSSKHQDA